MPPPPSFGGSPQPAPPATSTVEPLSPEDKLNTLFVGAIAAGISDAWIETLLKVNTIDTQPFRIYY
jgi:RNA-binding protein 25